MNFWQFHLFALISILFELNLTRTRLNNHCIFAMFYVCQQKIEWNSNFDVWMQNICSKTTMDEELEVFFHLEKKKQQTHFARSKGSSKSGTFLTMFWIRGGYSRRVLIVNVVLYNVRFTKYLNPFCNLSATLPISLIF